MSYGLGAYKKTSIHTASKEQILLMLYQTAKKHLKMAMQAIENKDYAKKGEHIAKFQDIIFELSSCLDFSVSDQLAGELASLYDFLIFNSTQGNMKADNVLLKECLEIVETLYSGWDTAIKSLKNSIKEEE